MKCLIKFLFWGFLLSYVLKTTAQEVAHNLDANLKSPPFTILVNGDSIDNFIDSKKEYRLDLPFSTARLPKISTANLPSNFKIKIINPVNLKGTDNERTATIVFTSKGNNTSTVYRLIFKILPKLDLFLLIGQSNMAGRGTMTPQYLDTLTNTYLLSPTAGMIPATNPLNRYSTVRKDIKLQQVGPGYGFSKKLVITTGANIGLIVNARGATSINSWEKGHADQYYQKAVLRMKSAQKWGTLKAILWHQGEGDSKHPETYMKKLANLAQNLRTDLNSPNAFFVAGELAYWRGAGNGSTNFNAMIQTISQFIPNSDWVSAEGLTPLIDESDPHFDAKSQVILGERYADKVLKVCY